MAKKPRTGQGIKNFFQKRVVAGYEGDKVNKVRNFQFGTNGNDDGTKTFTVKARTKEGTKAYNVRCNANRGGDACKIVVAAFQKLQRDMASVPDDNDRTRKIVKKRK
jgi:hypothetical protein